MLCLVFLAHDTGPVPVSDQVQVSAHSQETSKSLVTEWAISPTPRDLFLNSFNEIDFTYHRVGPFKVYHSVLFSVFTGLYNHHHNLIFEHLVSPKEPYTH